MADGRGKPILRQIRPNIVNLRCKVLWIALLGAAVNGWSQSDPQRDFVLAGKNAYILLPPEYVCSSTVKMVAWSADGQRLAAVREASAVTVSEIQNQIVGQEAANPSADPETQIVAWSTVSRKAVTLLKFPKSEGEVISMDWITGSSSLLVQIDFHPKDGNTGPHVDLIVLTTGGQITKVAHPNPQMIYEIRPSPTKPIVALLEQGPVESGGPGSGPAGVAVADLPASPSSVSFLGADAKLSLPIKLPKSPDRFVWTYNGLPFVSFLEQGAGIAKKENQAWYMINRTSQKLERGSDTPNGAGSDADWFNKDVELRDLSASASVSAVGVFAPTVAFLHENQKDVDVTIVTTDGTASQLSPKVNAVSYVSQGSLMVRQMAKVPVEAYLRAKEEAIKAKAISQAKMAALALMMYANDYDDVLLSNAGGWQSQVEPYIRNRQVLDAFTYTFAGGNIATLKDPANTELGYASSPGGRAVAYADGHVVWVPNP